MTAVTIVKIDKVAAPALMPVNGIRILKLWTYRLMWVNNPADFAFPRRALRAIWDAIPRNYRDNHITVLASFGTVMGGPEKMYVTFHDDLAWAIPANYRDPLRGGDSFGREYTFGEEDANAD